MQTPISQVKSLCTAAELSLVQSSRSPQLEKWSETKLRELARRARKLHDKWQGQSRQTSRRGRRKGAVATGDTRTDRKVQIFREALASFEKRAAALTAANSPAPPARSAAKSAVPAAAESTPRAVRPSPTVKPAAAASISPARPSGSGKAGKPAGAKSRTPLTASLDAQARHLAATTAAKKARIARGGLTARMHGHVSARGKRAQARRDRKRG